MPVSIACEIQEKADVAITVNGKVPALFIKWRKPTGCIQ